MKQLWKVILALFFSVLICIPSAFAIFYYTQPMKDVSYEFFSLGEDTGWTVFTDEKGNQTHLASDGYGGYLGLSYSGQTIYYSKNMTEKLDDPMLKIFVVNRTVSVFLDGNVIYTDCPELDNRIGYLTLPMLDYDRAQPVTISLPPDYHGKTLTIAQSTGDSEKQVDDGTVWSCEVMLYCGYAYESSLIASAAQTMLPAVLLFALILFLLAIFIWNTFERMFSLKPVIFALALLFQMCGILSRADFFFEYFRSFPFDLGDLFFYFSIGALLLFVTLYASRLRLLFAAVTALQWISALLYLLTQSEILLEYGKLSVFFMKLPQITGFFALITVLAAAFYLWKCGIRFFRHQIQAALLLTGGYMLFLIACAPFWPDYVSGVFTRIWQETLSLLPDFSLRLLWNLYLISSLAAVFLEFVEQISARRTELAVLSTKNALAMESYENLCLQSEEVMMLRHDTLKHYSLLRTMANEKPGQIAGYLDDLIGQAENVRSVISSRNQILNILLNGKLSAAKAKGIRTEIIRCDAPKKLPLSDAELCSLIVNILDNAINAAGGAQTPYLKLDLHCKDQHFVFSCINSMPHIKTSNKKAPTPDHEYGLKIIRQIMNRFGDNMLLIEQSSTVYQITVIIPF